VNEPSIYFTSVPFVHARGSLGPSEKANSCNESLCWIAESPIRPGYQVLINGLKRGVPSKLRYEAKSRPWLSKMSFLSTLQIIKTESIQLRPWVDISASYFATKLLASEYQTTKSRLLATSPFTAWIRNGVKYQSFDISGNEVRSSN